MLSFEELAVLLSVQMEFGLEKSSVAHTATQLYSSGKFDKPVALTVISNLVERELIQKDNSGFYFLTNKGQQAIKKTKEGTRNLMKRLLLG